MPLTPRAAERAEPPAPLRSRRSPSTPPGPSWSRRSSAKIEKLQAAGSHDCAHRRRGRPAQARPDPRHDRRAELAPGGAEKPSPPWSASCASKEWRSKMSDGHGRRWRTSSPRSSSPARPRSLQEAVAVRRGRRSGHRPRTRRSSSPTTPPATSRRPFPPSFPPRRRSRRRRRRRSRAGTSRPRTRRSPGRSASTATT